MKLLHKCLFALLSLCLASAPAAAQEIAVKGGVNITQVTQDATRRAADQSAPNFGVLFGGTYAHTLRDRLGIQIEALFTQKGNTLYNLAANLDDRITLNYVEFPVLASAAFRGANGVTYHLHVGPTFAFKVSSHEENLGEKVDAADEVPLKGADVGLALGGQLEKNRWLAGVRYTHGLTNIFKGPNPEFVFSEMKNKAVSLYVGYTIR